MLKKSFLCCMLLQWERSHMDLLKKYQLPIRGYLGCVAWWQAICEMSIWRHLANDNWSYSCSASACSYLDYIPASASCLFVCLSHKATNRDINYDNRLQTLKVIQNIVQINLALTVIKQVISRIASLDDINYDNRLQTLKVIKNIVQINLALTVIKQVISRIASLDDINYSNKSQVLLKLKYRSCR